MEKFDQRVSHAGSQASSQFHKELLEDHAKVSKLSSRESSLSHDAVAQHRVKPGETLWSIAKQSLSAEGKGQPSAASIKDEIARLVELNSQRYPYLKKSPKSLQAGAVLDIYSHASPERDRPGKSRPKEMSGPELVSMPCSESRPWKIVNRGESADAEKCDYVIAHSGSKVVAYEGSEVYANRGAFILALPGSRVHAKSGSRIAAHGVNVDAEKGAVILDL